MWEFIPHFFISLPTHLVYFTFTFVYLLFPSHTQAFSILHLYLPFYLFVPTTYILFLHTFTTTVYSFLTLWFTHFPLHLGSFTCPPILTLLPFVVHLGSTIFTFAFLPNSPFCTLGVRICLCTHGLIRSRLVPLYHSSLCTICPHIWWTLVQVPFFLAPFGACLISHIYLPCPSIFAFQFTLQFPHTLALIWFQFAFLHILAFRLFPFYTVPLWVYIYFTFYFYLPFYPRSHFPHTFLRPFTHHTWGWVWFHLFDIFAFHPSFDHTFPHPSIYHPTHIQIPILVPHLGPPHTPPHVHLFPLGWLFIFVIPPFHTHLHFYSFICPLLPGPTPPPHTTWFNMPHTHTPTFTFYFYYLPIDSLVFAFHVPSFPFRFFIPYPHLVPCPVDSPTFVCLGFILHRFIPTHTHVYFLFYIYIL